MHEESSRKKKIMGWLSSTFREALDRSIEDDRQRTIGQQFSTDLVKTTAAFTELGASKHQIYDLLRKYFDINNLDEIDAFIKDAAQIEYPLSQLQEHLKECGFAPSQIDHFIQENQVAQKLAENPELAKLQPSELKQYVEKRTSEANTVA